MDIRTVTKGSLNIIGLQLTRVSDNADFPKLWEAFSRRVDEVKELAETPIMAYGVCSNLDMEANQFDYLAGLAVSRTDQIPDGMTLLSVPEEEYAVFECTLPTLMETIKKIYAEYLPNSPWQRAQGKPELEEYDPTFDPIIPDSRLLVYVPIEKRKG